MKRRVWFARGNSKIYPNTYTILVGRAGVGKGQAIIPAQSCLSTANTANILSDRITMPFILEKLSKGFPTQTTGPNGGISIGLDSSCIIFSDELEVFIKTGEDVITNLTALWDSREHPFGYGTRGKGSWDISKPSVSWLAGATPSIISRSIPIASIGGGFTRRINFIYSKEAKKEKPFMSANHTDLMERLIDDLRYISSNISGDYSFEDCVNPLFEKYYKESLVGELEDEATATYKDSKWVHAIKLAMVLQAAENDSHKISKENWKIAAEEIDKVVLDIEIVFRGVGMSDLTIAADRMLQYVEVMGFATKDQLRKFSWQYVMGDQFTIILETLKAAGMLIEVQQGNNSVYKPVTKGATNP